MELRVKIWTDLEVWSKKGVKLPDLGSKPCKRIYISKLFVQCWREKKEIQILMVCVSFEVWREHFQLFYLMFQWDQEMEEGTEARF